MPEQDDDRISSFIDPKGIDDSKDYIITALNDVLKKIQEIDKVKLSLFGAGTLSKAVTDIQAITKANNELAKSQQNLFDVSIKESKLREQQERESKAVIARRLQEIALANKQAASTKKNGGGGTPEDLGPYKQLKKEVDDAFLAFANLRKETGRNTNETNQLLSRYKALKSELVELQNAGKQSTFVDTAGLINKFRQLTAETNQLEKNLKQLGSTQIGRNSQEFKTLSKTIDESDKYLLRLLTNLKKVAPGLAELEAKSGRNIAGSAEKRFDKEIAAGNVLNNTYAALHTQLKQLQTQAEEYAAKQFLGTASRAEIVSLGALQVQIQELSQGIVKIDTQLGRAGKNTTAYTRQLFSLQQVLRETPSLAFGFSTFISAIGNNLPILADDIKRIKDENKALAASGQKTESVGRALARSFFSWQTALLAVISVVAIYATEIAKMVTELFRSEDANRRAYLASKEYGILQDKLAKSTENLTKSFMKLNEIRNRSNDTGLKQLKAELSAVEALGVSQDKLYGIKKKIVDLQNKAAGENQEATADAVSNQFSLIGQRNLPNRRDEIQALRFDQGVQVKNQQPQVTKTDFRGNEVLVSANTPKQIARAKELEDRLKQEIAFKKKENALELEQIALSDSYTTKRLSIEKEYQDGRLSLEQFTNQKILNETDFLFKSKEVAGRNQRIKEKVVQFREGVVDIEGARVIKERGDPAKDKAFLNAEKLADSGRKESEVSENIFKQSEEAYDKSLEAKTESDKLYNETKKFNSDEARKIALAEAEAEVTIIRDKNEAILSDERSTHQQKINALEELRKAREKSAAASFTDVKNDISASPGDRAAALRQYKTEVLLAEKELNRARIELDYEYLVRKETATTNAAIKEKEFITRLNEEISTNIEANLRTRIEAEQDAFKVRKDNAEQLLRLELTKAGLSKDEQNKFLSGGEDSIEIKGKRVTYDELKLLRVNYEAGILSITADSSNKQFEIIKAQIAKETGLREELQDKIELALEGNNLTVTRSFTAETDALKVLYKNKLISIKDYGKQQEKLNYAFAKKEVSISIEAIDKKLKLYEKANEKLLAADENLIAARAQLEKISNDPAATKQQKADALKAVQFAKELYEAALEFIRKRNELLGEKQEKVKSDKEIEEARELEFLDQLQERKARYFEVVNGLEQLGNQLAQSAFERKQQEFDEEMSMLDRRIAKEREIIEQSVGSEEEKSKRLGELRIREEALRENLEKRRRKMEYDRAKAEKIAALASIFIDVAQKIVMLKAQAAILAVNNPVGAARALAGIPFILAGAAVGIATIAAQPLPKYAEGVKDHPGGQAIMGDAYRRELVIEKDGSMWVTAAQPTVYDLPKHSMVLPDADKILSTQARIETDKAGMSVSVGGYDVLDKTMRNGFDKVARTIKNQPVFVPSRDMNKDLLMRYGSDYYKYL